MRTFLPIILTVLILVSPTLFSQESVVTENGQIVILNEDGTWRSENPEEKEEGAILESPSTLIALTRKALEGDDADKALSYAKRALDLAEQTYGKAFFYYGVSAWASGDVDLALSTFENCSKLARSRHAGNCRRELERLRKATTNGTYDPPPWATDPTYLDERIYPR